MLMLKKNKNIGNNLQGYLTGEYLVLHNVRAEGVVV